MRLGPQDHFLVLGKRRRRHKWDAVYATGNAFQPSSLRHPGKQRIGNSSLAGLHRREQPALIGQPRHFSESLQHHLSIAYFSTSSK